MKKRISAGNFQRAVKPSLIAFQLEVSLKVTHASGVNKVLLVLETTVQTFSAGQAHLHSIRGAKITNRTVKQMTGLSMIRTCLCVCDSRI